MIQPKIKRTDKKNKDYFYLINGIRGFALINMLLFHFYYDIFMIFGVDTGWYKRPWVHVWQQFICISFLFLTGISWHFGHNNIKKGLLLNLYGLIITAVTLVVMPTQVIWFGILNGIGCATLLLCLLDRAASKWNPIAGFIGSIFLFLLFRNLSSGYLGFGSISLVTLPAWFYRPRFMAILGCPYPGFTSSDYFPILPWSFIVFSGYFFWKTVMNHEKILNFFRIKIPLFSLLGQKTIWIYMLHQPILYGIAYLLMKVLG